MLRPSGICDRVKRTLYHMSDKTRASGVREKKDGERDM